MPAAHVIIGAGLAGATAAATLRQDGFDGDIVVVGEEPFLPYERPPLSKQYLRGDIAFEKTFVRPAGFYERNRIDLLSGARATRIDSARKIVHAGSRHVRYDKLLIATGVRNRRLDIPGMDLPGIFSLRSVADADAIRRHISQGRKALVVGMGFIGAEVAASLVQKHVDVVSIDPSPAPLFRALGARIGQVIAAVHREHGVDALYEDAVIRFEGNGHVERAITRRGRNIDCDFAVVGAGVEPAADFLEDSGIATDNGILVDERCRTNIPDVWAAGDIANHQHPVFGRRIRVEHFQNAIQQGGAAARNMLGTGSPFEAVPWFWSDQYDLNIQYAGFHSAWDAIAVRGSLEDRHGMVFYLRQGRIDAIAALNRGKDLRRAMPLIAQRDTIDPKMLTNENVDVRDLARSPVGGEI
jgi:3-phenylpropionate/trans-cinnamate dioxygenase ferredoxin reductase subunit